MMRKLLSSTVLGGALAFAAMAGVSSDAGANTFRDLSPNSSWAVSKIENANARPYCALARRFTNDIVLTFARNKHEETSIAIDFQKPRLNSHQYYNVKINAGNNQKREFNIKPVSDSAVVLKIGVDNAFMKAMAGTGEMKADIEGHVYAFKVTELNDGENKMDGCLASLVEPAAGGAFDEPIRPKSNSSAMMPTPVADTRELLSADPQDNDFVSKITESEAELAREVDQLQDENKNLRIALEKERREFEDKFMAQSADSSAAMELSEKVQLLEVENSELRRKLTRVAATQKQAIKAASVNEAQCEANMQQDSAMARELELLRGEKETLQLQLKKAEARAATATNETAQTNVAETAMMQDLSDRITFLEQENRTLKTQLNEAADMKAAAPSIDKEIKQQLSGMQNRIETLEMQKESLESRLASKAAMQNNTASVESLQQRVDNLLAENTRLSKTIENMDTGASGTAADSFLVSKVKTLETSLQNVKRERNSLLEKIDAMNESRENGLIEISSESWDLEKATRRYNEAEREIQRLGLELEQQRSRCNAEKREIEYMLFDPSIAKREQIARLTEAEERAAKAETLLQAQATRYDDQIAMLEDRTKAMKRANAELEKAQIENIAAKELEHENEALMASLQQTKEELQDVLTTSSAVKEKNRELLLGIRQAESEIAAAQRLEEEYVILKADLQKAESEIASAKQLENEYEALKANLEEVEAESQKLTELEQQNKMLLANLGDARNKIEQLKTVRQQETLASADIERMQREKEFLMQKTAELEKDNVLLSRNIRETEEKLAMLQQQAANDMSNIETASGNESASEPHEPQKVIASTAPRSGQAANDTVQREALPVKQVQNDEPLPLSPRSVNNYSNTMASSEQAQNTVTSDVKSSAAPVMTGVASYLDHAGITTDNGVKQTEEGRNFAAYSWESNGLYGSAEQQIIAQGQSFEDMVFSYLTSTENRCAGEFASVLATDETIAGMRVSSYEIACIADDMSASASVVFIEEDGQFTTIAHEAGIDYMDFAMDMRDKLIKSLGPVEMASK